jgi:hypothetical protein
MYTRTWRAITASAIAALIIGAGAAPAGAAEPAAENAALAQFRANLTAASEVASFDALTADQRTKLARYLLGESDPFAQLSGASDRAGDFAIRTSASTSVVKASPTDPTLTAAASTRTVSAWQSFVFAGITISKTTVRETYYYSGARATSIASYSCFVNANYDPFATVTTSKDGSWTSSGKATAECRVTVKRGVPTPWGPIAWSTASNVQYVTGNGYGSVTSHGWR